MSIDFETSVNHSAQIKQKMAPQHASHPEMDHKTSESASVPQGSSPKDSVASSPATSFDSLSSLSPQYIEEPMMTGDRYSEPMDLSDDSNYGMNLQSPQQMNGNTLSSNALKELKNSLDKDGVLGQSLANGYVSEGGSTMVQRRNSAQTLEDVENANLKNGEFDNFSCHICSFQGTSKEEYNQHMPCHFTYKCPICDYTSRTRGRLTRHISDFHSETPPESWARRNDTNADKEKGKEKSKTLKCKQCGFTCNSKQEYYGHLRTTHMDAERVLKCPHCYFVTMYKHHFEYHLRNHVGLKPFRCNKCNYSCVNKSMLNSHKKSHSQIYPFRCGSCTYASKYCHSLKIHLRKYLHKPGQTLNADGTPNNNSIDVYGRRRGPKSKKAIKAKSAPTSKALVCTQSSAIAETVPDQQYSTQYFQPTNSFPSIFMGSSAMGIQFPSFPAWAPRPFKCRYCDFVTDSLDLYQQHVVSHASRENPDLIRTYNISINPEVFHLQAQHLTFNNFPQNPIQYANNSPQVEHRNDTQFSSVPSSTITGENSQLSSSPDQVHEKRSDDSPPKNNKIKQSPSTREETLANNLLTIGLATQYSSISKEFKKMDISNDYCYTSNVNEFKNNTSLNTAPDAVTLESFSISPKPSTMYSARELVEISDNSLDNSIGRHSPLDLSKTKYSLAYQANELHNLISMKSIQNGTSEHPTQNKTLEHPTQNRTSIPRSDSCTPSRNRRKGKAFKLDQFIKSDESPIKTNFGGTGLVGGSEKPKKSLINRKRKDSSSLMNSLWTNTSPDTGEERYKSPIVSLYFNGHGTPSPKKFATNRRRTSSPDQSESAARTSPACSSYSNDLAIVPKLEPGCIENNATQPEPSDNSYTCKFCEMDFKDCAMYTMHMGYHGYGDPYTCNKCGIMCGDKVEFFLHLVRVAHL